MGKTVCLIVCFGSAYKGIKQCLTPRKIRSSIIRLSVGSIRNGKIILKIIAEKLAIAENE
jgi:hypothetical protein